MRTLISLVGLASFALLSGNAADVGTPISSSRRLTFNPIIADATGQNLTFRVDAQAGARPVSVSLIRINRRGETVPVNVTIAAGTNVTNANFNVRINDNSFRAYQTYTASVTAMPASMTILDTDTVSQDYFAGGILQSVSNVRFRTAGDRLRGQTVNDGPYALALDIRNHVPLNLENSVVLVINNDNLNPIPLAPAGEFIGNVWSCTVWSGSLPGISALKAEYDYHCVILTSAGDVRFPTDPATFFRVRRVKKLVDQYDED